MFVVGAYKAEIISHFFVVCLHLATGMKSDCVLPPLPSLFLHYAHIPT